MNVLLSMVIFLSSLIPACQQAAQAGAGKPQAVINAAAVNLPPSGWINTLTPKIVCQGNSKAGYVVSGYSRVKVIDARAIGASYTAGVFYVDNYGYLQKITIAMRQITKSPGETQVIEFKSSPLKIGAIRGSRTITFGYSIFVTVNNEPLLLADYTRATPTACKAVETA